MTDKDLGKSIENAKEEIENLKNKEFKIFGIKVTAITIGTAIGIASSGIGALYGVFLGYQDYIGMKKKIAEYVAPDFSEFDKRLAVIEENASKTAKAVQEGSDKTAEYTRDIKNDLKNDIRRLEKTVEDVERGNKTQQREIDRTVAEVKTEVRNIQKAADASMNAATKEMNRMAAENTKAIAANNKEVDSKLKAAQRELDEKLKKALDNPLANK